MIDMVADGSAIVSTALGLVQDLTAAGIVIEISRYRCCNNTALVYKGAGDKEWGRVKIGPKRVF